VNVQSLEIRPVRLHSTSTLSIRPGGRRCRPRLRRPGWAGFSRRGLVGGNAAAWSSPPPGPRFVRRSGSTGTRRGDVECEIPPPRLSDPRVVAVGETGLDYHYDADFARHSGPFRGDARPRPRRAASGRRPHPRGDDDTAAILTAPSAPGRGRRRSSASSTVHPRLALCAADARSRIPLSSAGLRAAPKSADLRAVASRSRPTGCRTNRRPVPRAVPHPGKPTNRRCCRSSPPRLPPRARVPAATGVACPRGTHRRCSGSREPIRPRLPLW
jgi:hypothetical protein